MKTFTIHTEHVDEHGLNIYRKFNVTVTEDSETNSLFITILDPTKVGSFLFKTNYPKTKEETLKDFLADWAKQAFYEDLTKVTVHSDDEVFKEEEEDDTVTEEEIEELKLKEMLEAIYIAIGKYLGY